MPAILVVTCSDRAYRGEYEDQSGREIVELLLEYNPVWKVERRLIPDEADLLEKLLLEACSGYDVVITCGGTGIGRRDITPEVTRRVCDRELPGVAEMLRMRSLSETPFSVFSRGTAGVRGQTIVVNLPGSVKAARFCTRQLMPLLEHGLRMLRGEGH